MLFKQKPPWITSSFGPVTVPEGHYLMLGDNRDNSGDYRVIGFVPRASILGRASSVAFSFDVENYYLPRANRLMRSLRG
jgi:signal peptidase I